MRYIKSMKYNSIKHGTTRDGETSKAKISKPNEKFVDIIYYTTRFADKNYAKKEKLIKTN